MAAVSKGESLLYKDARSYCAKKLMNTMWKSMRVDRRFDSLLDKQLYHLDKARSYRSREIDQEQEQFLDTLNNLFERQCEIAASKLELEIAEQMVKNQKKSADARLRGSRRKSLKRMQSFTVPIQNVLTESEVHVVPGCEHERRYKSTLGDDFRVSSAQSFGRQSRQQFVKGFEDPIEGRKSACCGQDIDVNNDSDLRQKSLPPVTRIFQTEDQVDSSSLPKHEGMPLEPCGMRRPSSRKHNAFSHGGTERQAISWGKQPTKLASSRDIGHGHVSVHEKVPARSRSVRHQKDTFKPSSYFKPSSATSRCTKCEPTIAWEIVPRHKLKNQPKSSSKLQSSVFQPGQRIKTTDEETMFRKQFLACAMSRFLPISALQGSSFGEHNDVRKKMEGRRRCLEELKHRHRMEMQKVPPPRRVVSKTSDDSSRATSSHYTDTPAGDGSGKDSVQNETPGDDSFFQV